MGMSAGEAIIVILGTRSLYNPGFYEPDGYDALFHVAFRLFLLASSVFGVLLFISRLVAF